MSVPHLKSSLSLLLPNPLRTPPEAVGMSFAADVLKQNRQLILVLRETASSYTAASLIENEKHDTLRDALARLCIELHPIDGPSAIIRTDPAPAFVALKNHPVLQRLNISLDIGRVKNINKNPVAEKAISELHDELLRQQPGGGPVSHLELEGGWQKTSLPYSDCCSEPFSYAAIHLDCTCSLVIELLNGAN